MDPSLMYQAVGAGEVDVISAFSTDGRIAALDLRVLEDDRGAIPPYDAVILVERAARPRTPRGDRRRCAALDGNDRRRRACASSNLEVDDRGRSPAQVAAEVITRLEEARGAPNGSR